MPILGTIASSFRSAAGSSFEWIATQTAPTNSTNTLIFSNIPQTYTHLRIVGMSRDGSSQNTIGQSNYRLRWGNGSPLTSGYTYSKQKSQANGSRSFQTFNNFAEVRLSNAWGNSGNYGGVLYSINIIDIVNYTSSFSKSAKIYEAYPANSTSANSELSFFTALNSNSSPIDYIILDSTPSAQGGIADGAFGIHSTFNLYGIK